MNTNGEEGLMNMNYPHDQMRLLLKTMMAGLSTLLLVLMVGALTPWAQTSPSQEAVTGSPSDQSVAENVQVAKALEELLISMKMEDFLYQVEERPDPFMPFISEKVIQPVESDIEDTERLSGMRQFEPGQLSLVAIMFTESNPMAMVEDSSHKGYIIRRGTKIGKSGIVSDILPNQVIIKQLSYSMTKERKYKTVEMILRKEGEK